MLKKKTFVMLLITLLLTLSVAACNGKTEETAASDSPKQEQPAKTSSDPTKAPEPTKAPAPTKAPDPTDTPAPTNTPEAEEDTPFDDIANYLDSYHAHISIVNDISYVSGDTDNENVTMDMDWVKADNAYGSDMAVTMSGMKSDDTGIDTITFYTIDDNMHMMFDNQWMTINRSEALDSSDSFFFFNPEVFQKDLKEMKRIGKEKIDGIKTTHYRREGVAEWLPIFFGDEGMTADDEPEEDFDGDVKSSVVDLWIARDGGYLVKMVLDTDVENIANDGDEMGPIASDTLHWEYEITEINTMDSIELPEAIGELSKITLPGFEDDNFPQPENTTLLANVDGFISLSSELSEADVKAFYDEALTAMGWTSDGGMFPTWSKGDNTFSMIITAEDEGGSTILISSEK